MSTITTPASSNASPFLLKLPDVEALAHSDGFNILRQHLAQHYSYGLCDQHTSGHLEDLSHWLIVRDVLHALLVPVVELFDRANTLSTAITLASQVEDPEDPFTGPAQSAFLWLQCFLSSEKEREWCYTRGCPACVVERSLDSEFAVRLVLAACLLSNVHYPFTFEGPTLPSFIFFLDSLEQGLAEDPLYGASFFEITMPKAMSTRNGIEDLIHQCVELEIVLNKLASPPNTASSTSSAHANSTLGPLDARPSAGKADTQVESSNMVRRQTKLQMEGEQWMEEMFKRCCVDQKPNLEASVLSVPAHNSGAVLKDKPSVGIEEIDAGG